MSRPHQAVILAGGRGERLRPLTDAVPKPMIGFHGKPFLEYLVEQLRQQGFDRILLLLGYLPDKVRDHFGDGRRFGVRIEYSVTAVENETGARIRFAKDLLDPCFLLMYCDNYWPLRIDAMWDQYLRTGALAQLTVYSNKDGYTKHNLKVDDQGMVTCYDKTKKAPGLQGTDIGYILADRRALDLLPEGNVNLEKEVFPILVRQRKLSGFVTDHRYYSVGSHESLPLTERFLARKPCVILDRDGVLNEKASKADYVKRWDQFRWFSGAMEAVGLLKREGYTVIVVTNQAGIARGMMTESDLADIHNRMKQDLASSNASIDAIYHCPHGWDSGCECRKPRPGMLFSAQRDFHLDLSRTVFVGDDPVDKEAGDAACCPTLLVDDQWPLLRIVREKILGADRPRFA